jgi:hypothetical protein
MAEDNERLRQGGDALDGQLAELEARITQLEGAKLNASVPDAAVELYRRLSDEVVTRAVEISRLQGVLGALTRHNKRLTNRDSRRRKELRDLADVLEERNRQLATLKEGA